MKPKTYNHLNTITYTYNPFAIDKLTTDLLKVYIQHGLGYMQLRSVLCFHNLLHKETIDLTIQEFYDKSFIDELDDISWD